MNPVFLNFTDNDDPEKECGLNYITSIYNCYDVLHTHDFFEILLVVEGKLVNEIEGSDMILQKGAMVFFRPQDKHRLKQYMNHECSLINLTIMSKALTGLFEYMGESLESSALVSSTLPPCLNLSEAQLHSVIEMLDGLNTIPGGEKKGIRSAMRIILVELYFKYLPVCWKEDGRNLPSWLFTLCEEIKRKEVFEHGVSELVRLTGKNHSYLCRVFKKHFNTTPTEYINRIRLSYAVNLLLNSDMRIIDICFETGFESISHFYSLFEEHHGLTPFKYRKKYWKSLHRW